MAAPRNAIIGSLSDRAVAKNIARRNLHDASRTAIADFQRLPAKVRRELTTEFRRERAANPKLDWKCCLVARRCETLAYQPS
ncbi:hypothetical protein [Bradyrhizobium sp. CCBAU 11357]|uniref:hypothetical protein n=1 Tax=Bradyrhizobium sp. CCBAU 11357 TaxID=1630808 RepID=UPI00230281E0|nr:hypothetical protein [Bradyrhizobium sp. CCBAU 11357]